VTTGLIAQEGEALTAAPELTDNEWSVAALQMFAPYFAGGEEALAGPWVRDFGFRLNAPTQPRITIQHGSERRTLMLEDCVNASGFSAPVDRGALVYKDAQPFLFTFPTFSTGSAAAGDGAIVAPMPGKVTSIDVSQGEKVTKGQRLLTLEAMKMEHGMTAPFDGMVAELSAEAGAQVGEGTILARIEQQETK